MSSILKALKKVEEVSPKLDVMPDLPKKIDTKKAVNKRAKGTWLFNKTVTAVLVVVVVGAGIWLTLSNRHLLIRKQVVDKAPVEKAAPAPVAAPQKTEGSGPPVKAGGGSPAPERTAATGLPSEKPKVIEKSEENKRLPSSPADRPEPPIKAPAPKQSGRLQPDEPPADAGKFKLEAIVWATSPESRFAVINGQIVRVGDSVGNLSVREIGREHVAVHSGGRDWKMKFTVD